MNRIFEMLLATTFLMLVSAHAWGSQVDDVVLNLNSSGTGNPGANQVELTITAMGSLNTTVEIDLTGYLVATLRTDDQGNVSQFGLSGGSVAISDFQTGFNLEHLVEVDINGTEIAGSVFSNSSAGMLEVGSNGDFAANGLSLSLSSGMINGVGNVTGLPLNLSVDFVTQPLVSGLSSTNDLDATITVAATGNPDEYTIDLEAPVSIIDLVALNDPFLVDLDLIGTLRASGTFTAMPEPSSGTLFALIGGIGTAIRRRRC